MAAYFHHHLGGGTSHGLHGEAAEEKGHHSSQENSHQYAGVHQGDVVQFHYVRDAGVYRLNGTAADFQHGPAHVTQADFNLFNIGSQQRQGGEGGRSDGKALAGGGRGVAQGVQHVRLFTHGRIQFAHLGVAAGVVGDGTVSVCGQGDSQRGKHAHRRDGNAVQTQAEGGGLKLEVRAEAIGQQDGAANGNYGNGGGAHTQAHPVDHYRGRSRLGGLGQFLRGPIGMGGVEFRHLADNYARKQTAEHAQGQFPPLREAQHVEHAKAQDGDEDGTQVGAHRQRFQELLQAGVLLGADRINT